MSRIAIFLAGIAFGMPIGAEISREYSDALLEECSKLTDSCTALASEVNEKLLSVTPDGCVTRLVRMTTCGKTDSCKGNVCL